MRVQLRPRGPEDAAFVRDVYASTRQAELAALAWNPAQQQLFVDLQFRAFETHLETEYPDADHSIVLVDGEPAGRFDVSRGDDEFRVLDIALLPAYRGGGVGATLLSDLCGEADAEGVPVRLHVDAINPARRLYERLGFALVEEQGLYLLLERPATRTRPRSASQPLPARSGR